MLFKGYVKTKNKKCLEKFKGVKKLKSYDDVKNEPEYAGILADDIVLIDVDDFEESEILLDIVKYKKIKCKVYETTRGKHFYFKNDNVKSNKTNHALVCGIYADIKLGSKNSYSILKFNNKERKILYDSDEIDIIPKYLKPSKYKKLDFIEMEEGDGRNQKLFNYILTLQSEGFSMGEVKECIRLINDFVIYDPLPDNEIETILRDDAFKKPIFFEDKTFLFDKFAEFLVNTYHIKVISEQLHIYDGGVYISGDSLVEKKMIDHIPFLSRSKRNEVLEYIKLIAPLVSDHYENYIAFKNGLYDIENKKLIDFTPDIIIQNKVNFDFNPLADSELMNNTLNRLSCEDKDVRAIIEEMIGYCFFRRSELGMSFILIGEKRNGKSTLLGVIQKLLGEQNISSLDLKELGDRFKTAEVFGKLANIGDDIGDEFIPDTSIFKKLSTGDRLNVERKGQQPFEFNPYCKLIFSANNIPRIRDKTGAVQRRLIIVPFNATFDKSDPDFDPYIKTKLSQEEPIEYLIKRAIGGLHRVLDNNTFTNSKLVRDELEKYEKENNPILMFYDEITIDDIIDKTNDEVYMRYTNWCNESGYESMSKINFGKSITKRFDVNVKVIKITGKCKRIYKKN